MHKVQGILTGRTSQGVVVHGLSTVVDGAWSVEVPIIDRALNFSAAIHLAPLLPSKDARMLRNVHVCACMRAPINTRYIQKISADMQKKKKVVIPVRFVCR